MAIIDEVRRRAAQARFEAERLVRINRTQTRISALQGQLNAGAGQLGAVALNLLARGEISHPDLTGIADQLLALRAQIEALDAEVRAIRAEVFTEEPTSITCPTCGTASAPDGRFCSKCGTALQATGHMVQGPPAVQYGPAPVDEPIAGGQEIVCERCAAMNPPGMRFCVHCGTRLPIGTAGPAAPTWNTGTPVDAAWPKAAPTGAAPPRSASREAPTVRMPTLDPAHIAGAPRTDPTPSAAAGVPNASDQEAVETRSYSDADASPAASAGDPADADAGSASRAARLTGEDVEPAPSTLPLRGGAEEAQPGESSSGAPGHALDSATQPSTAAPSAPVCPSCGEQVVEGAAFCVTCGTRVVPA